MGRLLPLHSSGAQSISRENNSIIQEDASFLLPGHCLFHDKKEGEGHGLFMDFCLFLFLTSYLKAKTSFWLGPKGCTINSCYLWYLHSRQLLWTLNLWILKLQLGICVLGDSNFLPFSMCTNDCKSTACIDFAVTNFNKNPQMTKLTVTLFWDHIDGVSILTSIIFQSVRPNRLILAFLELCMM